MNKNRPFGGPRSAISKATGRIMRIEQFVLGTLNKLHKKGIKYFLIRHKEIDRDLCYRGDIDIIVHPLDRKVFFQEFLLEAKEGSFNLELTYPKSGKTVLKVNSAGLTIKIEIWEHLECFKQGNKTNVLLLDDSIFKASTFMVPPVLPADPGLFIYALHLEFKKKDLKTEEVRQRIEVYKQEVQFNRWLPEETKNVASQCIGHLLHGDAGSAAELAKTYMNEKNFRFKSIPKNRKIKTPRSGLVCFSGPDGSGKTTTSKKLAAPLNAKVLKFKKTFRERSIYKTLSKGKKSSVPSNIWDERNSNYILFLALLELYKNNFLQLFKRPAVKFYDRYFLDYTHYGIRDREKKSTTRTKLFNLFEKYFPRPLYIVLCCCPESTRNQRKPGELSEDSANKLYEIYIAYSLDKRIPLYCFSTEPEQDLEALKDSMSQYVLFK